jgi:hypothetical protein
MCSHALLMCIKPLHIVQSVGCWLKPADAQPLPTGAAFHCSANALRDLRSSFVRWGTASQAAAGVRNSGVPHLLLQCCQLALHAPPGCPLLVKLTAEVFTSALAAAAANTSAATLHWREQGYSHANVTEGDMYCHHHACVWLARHTAFAHASAATACQTFID